MQGWLINRYRIDESFGIHIRRIASHCGRSHCGEVMEPEGNGFTVDPIPPNHLLLPTIVTVPSPTPNATISTSSYKSVSATTEQSSSDIHSVATADINKSVNEVEDLIPDTQWPGAQMMSQPDLSLDCDSDQLHAIVQSAKMVLTGQYERPVRTFNKASHRGNKRSLSISLPSANTTTEVQPSPSPKVMQTKPKLRPKTAITSTALCKSKSKRNLSSASHTNQSQQSAATLHRYKPPDVSKVKREYRQLWNETGEMRKKNTSYIEIHYDNCLPPEDKDELRLKPTRFAHNHRHGHHWEMRYLVEEEKPKRKLKKVERIWENEFQMFKLDAMLDQQLKMRDS